MGVLLERDATNAVELHHAEANIGGAGVVLHGEVEATYFGGQRMTCGVARLFRSASDGALDDLAETWREWGHGIGD